MKLIERIISTLQELPDVDEYSESTSGYIDTDVTSLHKKLANIHNEIHDLAYEHRLECITLIAQKMFPTMHEEFIKVMEEPLYNPTDDCYIKLTNDSIEVSHVFWYYISVKFIKRDKSLFMEYALVSSVTGRGGHLVCEKLSVPYTEQDVIDICKHVVRDDNEWMFNLLKKHT